MTNNNDNAFYQNENAYMPEFDGATYPSLAYLGAAVSVKQQGGPFFAIDADEVAEGPKGFTLTEWQFGSNPNNPMTTVWAGQNLVCTILAFRRRTVIETPSGTKFYYHYRESRQNRVEGRYTLQTQLLLAVDGLGNEFVTLGLSGKGRTAGWDNNNRDKQYGIVDAPLGAMQQLQQFTREINRKYKERLPKNGLPWTYAWKICLAPLTLPASAKTKTPQPNYIEFGNGNATSFFAPFTMHWLGDKLTERYVGKEKHAEYSEALMSDEIQDWLSAWDTFSNPDESAAFVQDGAMGVEEDAIPF